MAGIAGGAAVSGLDLTSFATATLGDTGQLAVLGLRSNGDNAGTVGFGTNDIVQGIGLTPSYVANNADTVGATPDGVTLSTFTLDSTDLGNLIRLGNASRRIKGAPMIGYEDTVVAGVPGVASGSDR